MTNALFTKKRLPFLLVFAILLLPSVLAAGEVVLNVSSGSGATWYLGFNAGFKYLATNFTAPVDFTLGNASMHWAKTGGSGEYISYSIYDDNAGEPNNFLGTSEAILMDTVSGTASYIILDYPTPIELTAQSVYWIVPNITGTFSDNTYLPFTGSTSDSARDVLRSADTATWTSYGANQNMYLVLYNTSSITPSFAWVDPTPTDGDRNNVFSSVIINGTCTLSGSVSMWWNGTQTVFSSPDQGQFTLNASLVTGEGLYSYWGSCDGGATNTTSRTWIYDTTEPTITLNPSNGFTALNETISNPYGDILALNISLFDELDLFAFQVNITNPATVEQYSFTNVTLSGTTYNFTKSLNVTTWAADTLYTVEITSADSHTAKAIRPYQYSYNTTSITFSTDEGNEIIIRSLRSTDWTITKQLDRYSFNFAPYTTDQRGKYKFHVYCDNDFIYRATSPFDGHLVCMNWEEKRGNWLDFEGTGNAVSVTDEGEGWFEVEVEFEGGSVTFNSIGGLNTNTKTYSWYKGQATATSPAVLSGAAFTLSLNVTHPYSVYNIFAGLKYNNTDYSSLVSRYNHTNYTHFTANFTGFGVAVDSSFNVSWNVSYTALGAGVNGSFHANNTHTITTFVIDDCSVGTDETRRFIIFDELDTGTQLNGTVVIDGTYFGDDTDTKTLNISYASTPAVLCMSPAGTLLTGDLYIKYTSTNGFTHRWFLVNETFTNSSELVEMGNYNTTTGISDLKITLRRADNYQLYSEVVGKLQRRYPSLGVWKTVQMDQSGDYGLLFYNIQEENTDYRVIFMDRQNHVLLTTVSVKFVCSSGVCEIDQQLSPYSDSASSITPSIYHTFDNNTKLLTIFWDVPTGDSVTLNASVTKETLGGTTSICSTTSTGASGSIVCNTTGYDGELFLLVKQDIVPDYAAFVESKATNLGDLLETAEAAFWTFGLVVTVIMFGAILGPAAVAIATVLALVFIYFLGIFNPITLSFLGVAAILGVVVAIKVRT